MRGEKRHLRRLQPQAQYECRDVANQVFHDVLEDEDRSEVPEGVAALEGCPIVVERRYRRRRLRPRLQAEAFQVVCRKQVVLTFLLLELQEESSQFFIGHAFRGLM